jgi:alkylhydroperoxidase family enzyme
MRLDQARIDALGPDQLDEAGRQIMDRFGDEPLNIFRTMANHPDLLKRWLVFANHVLGKSSFPERERELLILRIGWLCRAGYEWGQHVLIGRDCGLSEEEIQRIKQGPDAAGWSTADADLLRAVDELHADAFITDGTWARLAEHWSTQQLMDIVFTVGQYNLVSMALNSFGVQPDPGLPRLED